MEFNHAILKKVLHGISETDGNSCFGDIGFEKTKMAIDYSPKLLSGFQKTWTSNLLS